jgi:hypothetical protein
VIQTCVHTNIHGLQKLEQTNEYTVERTKKTGKIDGEDHLVHVQGIK